MHSRKTRQVQGAFGGAKYERYPDRGLRFTLDDAAEVGHEPAMAMAMASRAMALRVKGFEDTPDRPIAAGGRGRELEETFDSPGDARSGTCW
jgi:hypothetical protein